MPTQLQGRTAHHIASEPTTALSVLQAHLRLDATRAASLLGIGAVYVNKKRVFSDAPLKAGDYLRAHMSPKRFPVAGIDWKSRVLAQAEDFVVVDKPAGIPVHATLDNLTENVLHQMRVALGEELLVTQRLDVPVSGAMVFARTLDFQRKFNRWLGERKVSKEYRALVAGAPAPGKLVHWMTPEERAPRALSAEEKPGWLRCELVVKAVHPFLAPRGREWSQVEIVLLTGRTHQIRAQLAFVGHPIVGDDLYGSRETFKLAVKHKGIALASSAVGWADARYVATPPWAPNGSSPADANLT